MFRGPAGQERRPRRSQSDPRFRAEDLLVLLRAQAGCRGCHIRPQLASDSQECPLQISNGNTNASNRLFRDLSAARLLPDKHTRINLMKTFAWTARLKSTDTEEGTCRKASRSLPSFFWRL